MAIAAIVGRSPVAHDVIPVGLTDDAATASCDNVTFTRSVKYGGDSLNVIFGGADNDVITTLNPTARNFVARPISSESICVPERNARHGFPRTVIAMNKDAGRFSATRSELRKIKSIVHRPMQRRAHLREQN